MRDKVPCGTQVKSSIPYSRAFTGKDIIVIYRSKSNPTLNHGVLTTDRHAALQVAMVSRTCICSWMISRAILRLAEREKSCWQQSSLHSLGAMHRVAVGTTSDITLHLMFIHPAAIQHCPHSPSIVTTQSLTTTCSSCHHVTRRISMGCVASTAS
ncbi:uncharacterized protein HD556DRAFT_199438 [Suillus plorans]|uniref:Uncharacterized protein n=1 Tax=Suillus plorans TaxID=116603 RepID=A0A9P7AAZ9_9AGAM|nr:uncharacterized protein HD556DRAFT_199438 [Suillus plorans]KAG1784736.1 hypothetical protein HD556DRAFT_199438 [Suillus plorans]